MENSQSGEVKVRKNANDPTPSLKEEAGQKGVPESDYGIMHTATPTPVYRDELYRDKEVKDRPGKQSSKEVENTNSIISPDITPDITPEESGKGKSAYDPSSKATGKGYTG